MPSGLAFVGFTRLGLVAGGGGSIWTFENTSGNWTRAAYGGSDASVVVLPQDYLVGLAFGHGHDALHTQGPSVVLGLGVGRVLGAALSDSQAINQMQTEQQGGISLADVLVEVSAVRAMAAVVEYDYLQPHMPWSRPALQYTL